MKRGAAIAGMLLASACAPPPPSSEGFALRGARQSFESGDLDAALRYTEVGMQRAPFDQRGAEISLHTEILRAMKRNEEAAAFSNYVERFTAGENLDSEETVPTLDECAELTRRRSVGTRLVKRYGELPKRRPFEVGKLLATYEIDAEGRPVNIHVVRARHPAAAWLIIDAIGEMRVRTARLARIDPAEFPISHCVYSVECFLSLSGANCMP